MINLSQCSAIFFLALCFIRPFRVVMNTILSWVFTGVGMLVLLVATALVGLGNILRQEDA